MPDWLTSGLLTVWALRAAETIAGSFGTPKLDETSGGASLPMISVVFSARNEAEDIRPAVESMLAQDYPDFEVIAVDDRSEDGTREVLHSIRDPRLTVTVVDALPHGWLGKTHGLYRGYRASRGEWLLFTDADVRLAPDALRRAVATAERRRVGHLTLFPRLVQGAYVEGAFSTYFISLFTMRYHPWMARYAWSPFYAGVGAFNLVRRDEYEKTGTHAALKLDIADDMMLAKLLKRSGCRSIACDGNDAASVRWVKGWRGVLSSLEKNAFRGLEYSAGMLVFSTVVLFFLDVVPFVMLFSRDAAARTAAGVACALVLCLYAAASRYNARFLAAFPAHPVMALIMIGILWRSALTAWLEGGVRWRETFYPLAALKKGRV